MVGLLLWVYCSKWLITGMLEGDFNWGGGGYYNPFIASL